ncbi:ATP-binding cassette domain-containing protein [uncultured Sunxiuqinia sp.]|uniref:ABC transporter ATP-binding protein n=1 Tax=uncultured Sunxiuqinia sp. TaxID=1573825 RepID=UPI002AA8E2C8|nr:ATP-binding cassette domain-containing protein [uncultured Sunxiuqinia sp.]
MITIQNIFKSFEDKQVLSNISTVFEPGKTNLIIGRSGSGKTVLLKSIVGLHDVDEGTIFYDDRNFTQMNEKLRKKLRQEMGMVFQGGALFDSFNVEENVRFPLDMFTNKTAKEKQERVDFCLDRVNIDKAHKLYPAEISGGMNKRVAIARAIVMNPKYLFCDEPNSGLDPETSLVIDELIHELTVDFKMTTVINTHDMNSVMEIGDKILFISEGVTCWQGDKDKILEADNHKLQEFVFANKTYRQQRDDKIDSKN